MTVLLPTERVTGVAGEAPLTVADALASLVVGVTMRELTLWATEAV
ncbi:hypothetical protein N8312_00440 [bacterium]|nr:hypothetical protein [bacterium]